MLTAIVTSLPGVPSFVLVVAIALFTAWLKRTQGAARWAIAGALALAFLAAVTQGSVDGQATDLDVLNAFCRTYLMGATLASLTGSYRATQDTISAVAVSVVLCVTFLLSVVSGLPAREYSTVRLSGYLSAEGSVRPSGWAASPNEMAAILGLGLILLIAYWVNSASARTIYFLFAAVLAGACIIATGTRSVLIACLLAAATVVVSGRRARMSTRRRIFLASILVGAAFFALNFVGSGRDLFGRDGDGSSVYRAAVAERVWTRLLSGEAPITGIGLTLGNQIPPNQLTYGVEVVDNSFFYVTAFLGVLGLVAFCAFVVVVAVWLVRRLSPALPVLVFLVILMFFENIVAWPSALMVAIICGGFLGTASPVRE
ncbi:hypothetical protein DBR36_09860 [Microbacterium sp. HMWF026]|nr:hypothetical protein DBR36_09860 [Microbacterium sp. HMWF026]